MSRSQPQIQRTTPLRPLEGWTQCPHCKASIPSHLYEQSWKVCPECHHHGRLTTSERIRLLCDEDSFQDQTEPVQLFDPLHFSDTAPYHQRWHQAARKTGLEEALTWGSALMGGHAVALAVMDFAFMGGSMGSAVGERLTQCCEWALSQRTPLIVICSSGGARMQEGLFSLLQMAKTALAFQRLQQSAVPILSLLTDPTCGGVTASFGTLADLVLAEPGALICFTGPRVIEQNLRQRLPPEAQRAEFLLARGMIDQIVPRSLQKERLAQLLFYLRPRCFGSCT